jgi:Helicase HerA-like C-terminal
MTLNDAFVEAMKSGYTLEEPAIVIGSPIREGEFSNETRVQVALSMMNRHGLVAGATGTGKTKTLQLRITARLQAARAAVAQDAMRDQVSPTTNTGLNTMTPAQQRREMQRQARELREAQKAADRQRREQAKEQARIERERQETMQTAIRTGGDILTSRTGQSVLRGIFGTIFGGGKSR